MKITIDTQADSAEDIKKAIELLQSLVGSQPVQAQPAAFNMFDAPQPEEKKEPQKIIPYDL